MRVERAVLVAICCIAFVSDEGRADEVTQTGHMNEARAYYSATALEDGRVLIAGGFPINARSQLTSAEIYDPATGTFAPTGSMNLPRWGHGAVRLDDGRVLIVGGWISSFTKATEARSYTIQALGSSASWRAGCQWNVATRPESQSWRMAVSSSWVEL